MIIDNNSFKGRSIRLALLSSHYSKPLDWTDKRLDDAEKALHKFYRLLDGKELTPQDDDDFVKALYDDINTPKAIARLHQLANNGELEKLLGNLNLIGLGCDDKL